MTGRDVSHSSKHSLAFAQQQLLSTPTCPIQSSNHSGELVEKLSQESTSIPLPPLLFCLPFLCFLTLCYMIPSCSLYPTSFPLHQLWGSSSLTHLLQFPKSAGRKLPRKQSTHIVSSSYRLSELHRLPEGCAERQNSCNEVPRACGQ